MQVLIRLPRPAEAEMSVEVLIAREVLTSGREEQVATEMSVRKEVAEVQAEVLTAVAVEEADQVEAQAPVQVVDRIAQVAVVEADQVEVHQGRNSIE